MKKYVIYLIAVLLAAGFAAQSLAAVKPRAVKPRAIKPVQPASRPALTPEQIAQLKADRAARREVVDAQNKQMKELTEQLRSELQKKPANQNRVSDLTKKLDILRDTMQIQQMEMRLRQNPDLKPADQKRYTDAIQRAKERLTRRQAAQ